MNAHQSAYEQGKIDKWDRITRTMDEVRAHHEAGKYVVIFESLSYCPYTDAPMGTMPHLLKACKTREEAEGLINAITLKRTSTTTCGTFTFTQSTKRPSRQKKNSRTFLFNSPPIDHSSTTNQTGENHG
jgi:hypothetical protein